VSPCRPHARLLLLTAICAIAALLTGCERKLKEADVRDFMDSQLRANDNMDYDTACGAYADDAKYTVVIIVPNQTLVMNKNEICDNVRSGYAEAKARGLEAHSQLNISQVKLDGAKATVSATLIETMESRVGTKTTNSSKVMESIEVIKGKLKITGTTQTFTRPPRPPQ
jgi:hypothetical protein